MKQTIPTEECISLFQDTYRRIKPGNEARHLGTPQDATKPCCLPSVKVTGYSLLLRMCALAVYGQQYNVYATLASIF